MKGYKAFENGMICLGKKYAENTVFEEVEAIICKKGMHFCKNPLDVLEYYPIVNKHGNISDFAEVEALDEPKTDDNKKYCTKKLKIGSKISFAKLIQASVNFDYEESEETKIKTTSKNYAKIGSSVNYANIGSSGNCAQIGSSGDYAKIGSSGNYANIGSSGNYAQIGSSGEDANIGSSGNPSRIGSSGNYANIGSSGNCAKIGSSGNSANIGSSGNYAQIGSSGNYAKIGSSGNRAKIGSSGNCAKIGSSGDYAKIGSSGDYAQIVSDGKYAVICCAGNGTIAKGKIGSWITLAEWEYDEKEESTIPVCVKTEKIDGVKIKEDTFYRLVNGEFVIDEE